MKRICLALAALSVVALSAAQSTDQTPDLRAAAVGFGFRLGGYFPADSKLRDVKSVLIDFGIEYDFEKSFMKNGTTYVAGDWISDTFLGGQHVADLTINQRIYTKNERFAAGGTPYFFAGVGANWVHAAGASNGTTWVVRGGIGSEFKGDYFAEVGGFLSPKIKGLNPSGVSLSIGYRFKSY